MSLVEDLEALATAFSGKFKGRRGRFSLEVLIAERKVFLSRRRLIYKARIRIDEKQKELVLKEALRESNVGLLAGLDFSKESYDTRSGTRNGIIEHQSRLFGQKYDYRFDFEEFRQKIGKIAEKNGYLLKNRIL